MHADWVNVLNVLSGYWSDGKHVLLMARAAIHAYMQLAWTTRGLKSSRATSAPLAVTPVKETSNPPLRDAGITGPVKDVERILSRAPRLLGGYPPSKEA